MADSKVPTLLSRAASIDPPPLPPVTERSCRSARSRYHFTFLILSAGTLATALLLEVPDPDRVTLGGFSLPSLCVFRSIVGADCPGCGLTRCFVAAAHGQLVRAWEFHAAGLFLFAVMMAQLPFRSLQIWRLSRGLPEWRHRALLWIPWLILITLAVEWLCRIGELVA